VEFLKGDKDCEGILGLVDLIGFFWELETIVGLEDSKGFVVLIIAVEELVFTSLVPALTEPEVLSRHLRTPAKDVLEEEHSFASLEAVEFGGVDDAPGWFRVE